MNEDFQLNLDIVVFCLFVFGVFFFKELGNKKKHSRSLHIVGLDAISGWSFIMVCNK